MATEKIKLDKDLLDKVRKFAAETGYSSVEEFITHLLEKEIAKSERRRFRGRDQEEAQGARLHRLSAGGDREAGTMIGDPERGS